jgi:hypothetical protein
MVDTKDIIERIELNFGHKTSEAIRMLDDAISKADHLNDTRIIRCVLFLADGDIEKLNKSIQAATADPRDVMYWAEYIDHEQIGKRVRDFTRPFNEAEINAEGYG